MTSSGNPTTNPEGAAPAPRSDEGQLRVAVVQAAPVYLDRTATVERACHLIGEAAGQGARIVVFGEGFLPGHPVWAHALPPTHARSRELASELVENAVTVPGSESETIAHVAKSTATMVIMGIVERPDPRVSVIYSSQLVLSPDGSVGVRRKLVPAVGERVFLTAGGPESVRAFESPWGPISVLAAGENCNPLLTYAMRSMGARLHVALWPPHFHAPGVMYNVQTITSRAVAYQNTAHVIAATVAVDTEVAGKISSDEEYLRRVSKMGEDPGSVIYRPGGSVLAGPQHGEGILLADVDLTSGTWAQLVNRQYDRPDLFRLEITGPHLAPGGTTPEPSRGERRISDEERSIRARRLIADRFGGDLTPQDVEALVPYVVDVLQRSDQLAERDPTSLDPRAMSYAHRDDGHPNEVVS